MALQQDPFQWILFVSIQWNSVRSLWRHKYHAHRFRTLSSKHLFVAAQFLHSFIKFYVNNLTCIFLLLNFWGFLPDVFLPAWPCCQYLLISWPFCVYVFGNKQGKVNLKSRMSPVLLTKGTLLIIITNIMILLYLLPADKINVLYKH